MVSLSASFSPLELVNLGQSKKHEPPYFAPNMILSCSYGTCTRGLLLISRCPSGWYAWTEKFSHTIFSLILKFEVISCLSDFPASVSMFKHLCGLRYMHLLVARFSVGPLNCMIIVMDGPHWTTFFMSCFC